MCVAIQTPKICTILFKFLLILVGDGGSPHPLPNTPIDPFDQHGKLRRDQPGSTIRVHTKPP